MSKKTVWMLLGILAASIVVLCGYILVESSRADRDAPVITMDTSEIELSLNAAQSDLMQGVTAWDERDGDVTDSIVIESHYGITEDSRVTVTYAAFDSAGNVTKAERQVYYSDYHSPRFQLSRALVYEYGTVADILSAVSVEDMIDGDLHRRVKATMLTSGTSVTEEGTHEVQFRVTNSLGDTVQLVLPVEIYPIDRYNAELTLTEYLVYLEAGDDIDPEDYLHRLETQRTTVTLKNGKAEGVQVKRSGDVDIYTPGVYPVTFTATYTDGDGARYTGYSQLIVVVEG